MYGYLKLLALGLASAVGGWAFVKHAGVVSAGTRDSTCWLWGFGFAAPMVAALVIAWARAARGGVSLGLTAFKVVCFVLAFPVAATVMTTATSVVELEREKVLRETGLYDQVGYYSMLPADPFRGADGGAGSLRGKVVVMDMAFLKVSDAHFRLPDDLAPRSPHEVRTVVHLDAIRDPSKGYGLIPRVRLVDFDSGTVTMNRAMPDCDADHDRALNLILSLPRLP